MPVKWWENLTIPHKNMYSSQNYRALWKVATILVTLSAIRRIAGIRGKLPRFDLLYFTLVWSLGSMAIFSSIFRPLVIGWLLHLLMTSWINSQTKCLSILILQVFALLVLPFMYCSWKWTSFGNHICLLDNLSRLLTLRPINKLATLESKKGLGPSL